MITVILEPRKEHEGRFPIYENVTGLSIKDGIITITQEYRTILLHWDDYTQLRSYDQQYYEDNLK